MPSSSSNSTLPIFLWDTYQKKLCVLDPEKTAEKGVLKFYSCGPTVYYYPHIGNMRAVWLADSINLLAKMAAWQTEWVLNVTDVGHLVGDGDSQNVSDGEDKVEKAAKKAQKTVSEIVEFYTQNFEEQCNLLAFELPTGKYYPKATEYIEEQMILALELLLQDKAYLTEDGIYFKNFQKS